jgi:hypothetical protein
MLFAASLLALTFAAQPAPSCTTPTQTGVFRITATTQDSSNASIGLVLLESVNNCLEATIIADEGAPAIIEQVALTDNVLTGRVHMRSGTAKVSFQLSDSAISGSIVSSKTSWVVNGRRTTGLAMQSASGEIAPLKTP